jgi:hypothetical protein
VVDNTPVFQYDGATSYDTIATEDIGGKKHQKFRLNIGAPGAEVILARGQQTKANSLPVALASDQDVATQTTLALLLAVFPALLATNAGAANASTMRVVQASGQTLATQATRSSSSTVASIAYSTTNVTLLAANANRLGATIYNGNTVGLVVKLGANAGGIASLVVPALGYYEVPFGYTGIIDGLWLAGGNTGTASVTELLP